MLRRILGLGGRRPADEKNERDQVSAGRLPGTVQIARVRAVATGAALAVSLDTSPAVLLSVFDYARGPGGRAHRTA